ncbi:hypothetical protein GLOIN_2v1779676 [Rhizophagus irregularis DAOM 181602=DAOM 197198]|uniref:Uncharacterized protein n=1 Tax=Rhizophagus irregularis (strain DAOM 181602 / DAOM 197198 / MUCL 43194) TaxID=747089 RepID=A0A2P4PPD0_RHIID|nr:hypothetical protein GLOIN_2v1779676 [Rhizophagus irregularis DAOM 181602=DAOM 197198]POG67241.1 hypothetical protein GLOIN_2v1779676 [Rhizophagus irregularis DAOM 181602=DAOM 197198]GET51126.1 hypothetical protein GLOIN_2v1779676 [Rhizophagus irregularis DAOM 181602=DAOM 197198]|eukprot:XP_025174107.1 hypothetical protein GLOIN_2v1779676 [Rhizophagus irregularis DAOM 181602=DAOM 197198]
MIQCYAIAQKHQYEFDQQRIGSTNDYAFGTVRREIRELTGEKIEKVTVKSFYYSERDPKFNTVMLCDD